MPIYLGGLPMWVLYWTSLHPMLMDIASGHYRLCRRDCNRKEDDSVCDSECDQHFHTTGQGTLIPGWRMARLTNFASTRITPLHRSSLEIRPMTSSSMFGDSLTRALPVSTSRQQKAPPPMRQRPTSSGVPLLKKVQRMRTSPHNVRVGKRANITPKLRSRLCCRVLRKRYTT